MALRQISETRILASYWGFHADGTRHNIGKRFPNNRDGKARAMKWLVEHEADKKSIPAAGDTLHLRTIREAVEFYTSRSHFAIRKESSRLKELRRLDAFLSWCDKNGLIYLLQFTQKIAEEYAVYCIGAFRRKGIEARIGLANRLFKADMNRDDAAIVRDPFRSVKKTGYDPPLGINRLTEDQITRVYQVLTDRELAILTLLFESGMRVDEFQHLRWCDITTHIDISSREGTPAMKGFSTKTGESGGIRITNGMQIALHYLRLRTGHQKYVLLGDRPAHTSYLNKLVARFEDRVRQANPDIVHFSPKTFRASIAMYLIDHGEDMHIVQRQLRHQSIKTTERYYGRAFLKNLDPSVKKINEGDHGKLIISRLAG